MKGIKYPLFCFKKGRDSMAILKRIKEKIKKAIEKKRSTRKTKTVSLKSKSKAEQPEQIKKEPLGAQETTVGKSKFFTPETPKVSPRFMQELPSRYGHDKIVLQVRDPWWLHSYWEIKPETLEALKNKLQDRFYSAKLVLRVYDVSNIIFNGSNAHKFFDIEIGFNISSWYIDTAAPGRSWIVDIGLRLVTGEFILIARSNVVQTPLDGPSWITDEEWMIPDDMFARLYGMGFGFGKSSPGKAWQERFKKALFSGVLASPGMASMASPVKKMPQKRKFWMVVNTELIVYGATEPDAKVTVQGEAIKLRPDGTFSMRFALPDGKQVIPVEGSSSDEIETITITPIVEKQTKYNSLNRQLTK